MAAININPTRMELSRLKKKLIIAKRGHKLLKDKRDELMRRFLELVTQNKELRERVEKSLIEANKNFVLAKAVMSEENMTAALSAPREDLSVEVESKNVMSVLIPVFNYKTRLPNKSDMFSYGFAFTSADLDYAIESLADVFPDMLKLAEVEKSCLIMATEIEKTRRRVNALEHVVIPETEKNIKYIAMKLDENERGAQVRLMKVKDMMIKENFKLKHVD